MECGTVGWGWGGGNGWLVGWLRWLGRVDGVVVVLMRSVGGKVDEFEARLLCLVLGCLFCLVGRWWVGRFGGWSVVRLSASQDCVKH